MLAALVRWSIRYRGVAVALALVLVVYGVYRLTHTSLDIFPEFAPKLVIVQTEAPGLAAGQVEVLVSQPLERALGGLVGVRSVRSQSIQGLSVVTVTFAEDTDLYRDRQLLAERLSSAQTILPAGIGPPVLVPLESSSGTIMTIGVRSDTRSLLALRDFVDWTLRPRLLSVPGVADVNVFGGALRQLQVEVDPDRIRRYGLGLQDVVAAARQAAGHQGGGFVENTNQRLTINTGMLSLDAAQLGAVVLRHTHGGNIRLADVARVREAAGPAISAAAIEGEPGVMMMIIGQYQANTLAVTRAVEHALQQMQPTFHAAGITLYPHLFRPADYIETSVHNLSVHLLIGAGFVVLVLLVFLFNLRTAFICATAIPLSLLSALLVLIESGASVNIMVLGGLAIALGEVVDDAIIDTENIYRRLRENRRLAVPRAAAHVVFEASMEVRGSVVYASFIVLLVFVPLLTLGGVAGRLFEPLGVTYMLAIAASLLVALIVTPALCYLLLAHSGRLSGSEPPLVQRLRPLYSAALRRLMSRPGVAVAVVVVVCAGAVALLPLLGGRFLPELREGHYIVHTASMPGTALAESLRIGKQLARQFLAIPGVRSVAQFAGRAELGADTYGSYYSEYEVDLRPASGREQQRVLEALRGVLRRFPGIASEVNTFLTERVEETISGYTAPIVVNIYGNHLDRLQQQAQQVAAIMRSLPGATDVKLRAPVGAPVLTVEPRMDRLALWGVRPQDVYGAVATAFRGTQVGEAFRGNRVVPIVVILGAQQRTQPGDVGALPIRAPDGTVLLLRQLADVHLTAGREVILHRNAQRLQTVTCNVSSEDINGFFSRLQHAVRARVHVGANSYLEFTGAAQERARARRDLLVHSTLAGVAVMVLLYFALRRVRNLMLMLMNLPFSLAGGAIIGFLSGGVLSVGSLIGFVTLFGITVRNAIMLVSHYHHLVTREGQPWTADTAVRGAEERLPSILMTALVTALAMLPIALNSDNPGSEIMGPMATIIIGGLVSSTVLNLLVLPVMMLRWGRFAPEAAESRDRLG